MAQLDGVKEIYLKTAPPSGVAPDAGYIYKWIEKINGDHMYKGMDSASNIFTIGTSGAAQIPARWEDNPLNGEGIRVVDNKEISIGRPGHGKEAVFGRGDSYTGVGNISVYTYDGATLVDVSQHATSESGSTISFPNTQAGTMIYMASLLDNGSDKLVHPGMKVDVVTGGVYGGGLGPGGIAIEFWNGSSWEEVNHMSTSSGAPYDSQGNEVLESIGVFQYLYNQAMVNFWEKNDPVNLGTAYYWVRYRLTGIVAISPVIEHIKLHPLGRLEINEDGFIARYGQARTVMQLPVYYGLFDAAGNSPSNVDFYLSDKLDVGMRENLFQSGTTDRSGFKIPLPKDICTACPIRLTFMFATSLNEPETEMNLKVRWGLFREGSGVYTSSSTAPTTAVGEKSITESITIPVNHRRKVMSHTMLIDVVEGMPSSNMLGTSGDYLVITFERNGSADTHNGNIQMIDVRGEYSSWTSGGHL